MRPFKPIFVACTMVISAVLGQTVPALGDEPKKAILAHINITASNWPAIVAQEKDFFLDEGLDIDWVQTGSSSGSAQQVMAGVANFGSSSMVDTFRAIDGGGDLFIFTNSIAMGLHSLVGAKKLESVEDLRGKRVMVGGQRDITGLWWYAMAEHYGMDAREDVDLLFAGSTANRLSALMAGGVDAAVISPPNSFQAFEQGYSDLGLIATYMGEFPMMIYHVNKSWAADNEDAVVGFVRAHNRAVEYMLDASNREEVSQILADATGSSLEHALRTYDMAVEAHAFVPDGSISEATVARVRSVLAEDGDLQEPLKPLEVFVDPTYVELARQ